MLSVLAIYVNDQNVDAEENCFGSMTEICENERNTSKKYMEYCRHGEVCLSELLSCTQLMKEVSCSDSPEFHNYWVHIREYNDALAFLSMSYKNSN